MQRVQAELVSKALLVFLRDVPIESCCDQTPLDKMSCEKDCLGDYQSGYLEDLLKSRVILQKLMLGAVQEEKKCC